MTAEGIGEPISAPSSLQCSDFLDWHLSNSGVYNLLPAREQGAKMDGPDRVEYAFLSVAVVSFFGFVAGVVALAIF